MLVRVGIGPLRQRTAVHLERSLSTAIRSSLGPDAALHAVDFMPDSASMIATIRLNRVVLPRGAGTRDYVALVHDPAVAIVTRALRSLGEDAADLGARVLGSSIWVPAEQMERLEPTTGTGPIRSARYRAAIEVSGVPAEHESRVVDAVAKRLRQRVELASPKVDIERTTGHIVVMLEIMGISENDVGERALDLIEDLVSEVVDVDDLTMRLIELTSAAHPRRH